MKTKGGPRHELHRWLLSLGEEHWQQESDDCVVHLEYDLLVGRDTFCDKEEVALELKRDGSQRRSIVRRILAAIYANCRITRDTDEDACVVHQGAERANKGVV